MISGCRSSLHCVDEQEPLKSIHSVPYKWPDSDIAFAKSVAAAQSRGARSPDIVDSYSCRQLYLRSYTFTKKETVAQKTRRCVRKLQDSAASSPIFSTARSADGRHAEMERSNKGRKKLSMAVRSLLFCGTKVEVAD
ncbi:uncharacterized protein LOC122054819 [Zingiber officinale]|uniref:Uncharacterized protein n=1 Tax=Zingiber officinale TaxID=94328 RepID=A0A8J5LM50_ZINOF|nr:uncharacterized protein LOC122054819 [Zingiber officinale]KAG6518149.1 hypothetical protein ZIOFF_021551 [Zingiber officinale]